MKKSFNLLLAFLMSVFVFSCSDITNTKLEEKASSSKVNVSFAIKGNDSRTALPVFDFASYKITAINLSTNEENTVYEGKELASISMEVGTYNFTLTATTSGNSTSKNSIYEGTVEKVEIKESNNSIIFSLALKESSQEYGSISVDLIVAESLNDGDISATADILNTDFQPVYDEIDLTKSDNKFNYTIPEIEAGNYFVKFSISKTGYTSTTRYIAVQVWNGLQSVGSVKLNNLNEAPTYTITYVPNNDTLISSKEIRFPYVLNEDDLPTPTRTGYTFAGWYSTETFAESSKAETGLGLTSDITLYAKWTENVLKNVTIENNSKEYLVDSNTTVNYTFPKDFNLEAESWASAIIIKSTDTTNKSTNVTINLYFEGTVYIKGDNHSGLKFTDLGENCVINFYALSDNTSITTASNSADAPLQTERCSDDLQFNAPGFTTGTVESTNYTDFSAWISNARDTTKGYKSATLNLNTN